MYKILKTMLVLAVAMSFFPISAYAQQNHGGGKRGAMPPVSVIAIKVQNKNFIDEVEALGIVYPIEHVDLTSIVTELVTEIDFKDGQNVKKGDVLVKMDIAEEQAQILEEEARLNEAKRQVKRLEPLAAIGAAPKSLLDATKRDAQTAAARIEAIKARIKKRSIVAPFDGILGLRNISIGAVVNPGMLITTIDDDRLMKLDFSIPEIYLSTIKNGIRIEAVSKAYPNLKFLGAVSSIDSRIDPVSHSMTVRALIKNPYHRLKSGLLMKVLLYNNPRRALVLPEEALILKGQKKLVFVVSVNKGKATVESRRVQIGVRREGEVEIISGLNARDMVVIHGMQKLRNGSKVIIGAIYDGTKPISELIKEKSGR